MNKEDIYVGDGATIIYHSDRVPATILSILQDNKRIIIQEDNFTRIDSNGLSEEQEYSYERNPEGEIHVVTLRKDGKYKISKTNTVVAIGARRRYYDPSF